MVEKKEGSIGAKFSRYWPLLIFMIVALFFASRFSINTLKEFLQQHEKLGLVISFSVYLLLGVTPIPTEPITLLVLAWKGPLIAIILATAGNTAASYVEFCIGGTIGDLADFEKKKEKLPFHLSKLPINSPAFLLCARMLPGYGGKFVSIASGVYRVPMFTYFWTTFVANLIGAVVLVFGGYGLITLIFK